MESSSSSGSLRLEVGKRYVRRDGGVTGPLERNTEGYGVIYPFKNPTTGQTYTGGGSYFKEGIKEVEDLVSEYQEQPTMTKQEALAKIEELKKFVEESDKPKVDPLARHKNPKKGDLFRYEDGAVFMAYPTSALGMGSWDLVLVGGPKGTRGNAFNHGKRFNHEEKEFTFIGNANENRNLITINVPS